MYTSDVYVQCLFSNLELSIWTKVVISGLCE